MIQMLLIIVIICVLCKKIFHLGGAMQHHNLYIAIMFSLFGASTTMTWAEEQLEDLKNSDVLPVIHLKADHEASAYTIKKSKSATKLDLSLKETPQSVSVITEQQMKDQNLTSVSGVLDQVPGIYRQSYGATSAWGTGGEYTSYYSRGSKIINFQIDGLLSSPAIEGRSNTALSNIDTAIFENITVVKGATGLLNGSGLPSASVNFNRKHATANAQSSAKLSYGSWNTWRSEIDASQALNESGSIRGRVVAAHQQGDSWQKWGDATSTILYGVVDADLSDKTVLSIGTSLSRNESDGQSIHAYANFDAKNILSPMGRKDNSAPRWAYTHTDSLNAFAQLQHEFENRWKLNANYNFATTNTESIYGVIGSNTSGVYKMQDGKRVQVIGADGKPVYYTDYEKNTSTVTAGYQHTKPVEHSVDLGVTGPYQLFGREHELMLGANFQDVDQNDPYYNRVMGETGAINIKNWNGYTAQPAGLYTAASAGNSVLQFRQYGGYLATRLNLLDHLKVILGGRVSSIDYYAESGNKNSGTKIKIDDQFTPYAGIVFDVTPEWAVYGSYTSIFSPQANKDYQMKLLDPKQGDSYELGVKGELFAGRVNTSLALFQSNMDNVAVEAGKYATSEEVSGAVAGTSYYRSAKGAKTKGFDVAVSGEVLPNLNLNGGYTYSETKEKGDRINTDIPKDQFKLFATYKFSGDLEKLSVGAGVTWQSKIYSSYDMEGFARDSNGQKAFTLVDAMAKYELSPDLTVGLNLNNITDKSYRLNTSNQTFGAPRSVTGSVSFKF